VWRIGVDGNIAIANRFVAVDSRISWNRLRHHRDFVMLFRQIYDTTLAQAAYLIGCQRTGEALVIDAERDVERYIEIAASEGLRITAIAETHIHADFLAGTRELAERTGATVYLSAEGGPDWQYRWLEKRSDGGVYPHVLLHDRTEFMVGNIRITALHTPGHTPEHMSYLVTDLGGGAGEPMGIATGDFVFVGDVGRPDLLETAAGERGAKEPSARVLYRSLREFVALPEYLQVWPGHGAGSACGKALGAIPQSTVGYEKRFNLAVTQSTGSEEEFVTSILTGQPEPPPYFARMKRENREGPALLGRLPKPRHAMIGELSAAADAGAVVVDTRTWGCFSGGHLRGALHAPLGKSYPTIVGSYIEPAQEVWLVVEESKLAEAVLGLIRVGLDRVVGWVTPAELEAASDLTLETVPRVGVAELAAIVKAEGPLVLDVRGAAEYAAGHVAGAINIAHTRLAAEVESLPPATMVYVHCLSGARSAYAVAYLRRAGYDARYIDGSWSGIAHSGLPVVTQSEPVSETHP
jgi:hydroxyacylglutathione hydrolase